VIKSAFPIPLKPEQELLFVPIGDIQYGTDECDVDRLKRFVDWCVKQEKKGKLVRLVGLGDYTDLSSPSEKPKLQGTHETTQKSIDDLAMMYLRELMDILEPLKGHFLTIVTGHHHHIFSSNKKSGGWGGKSSDEWLAKQLGCEYGGDGHVVFRLKFPHNLHLDVGAWHGGGGGQTAGWRVNKRIRQSDIYPTAHIVIQGHDNAKLAYPRSGLDWEHGMVKRMVIGSGSFQRAYLEGDHAAGYAEKWGLVPADLGVTIMNIQIEQRHGKWRVDFHASV